MVIDKHRRTGKPLAVELSPNGLAPSRVGHGQMQAVFLEVVPEDSGGKMSQRIEEVMRHHLGLSACAAGEVHQHGVRVVVGCEGALKGGRVIPFLVPRVEAFILLGAYAYQYGHGGMLHGVLYLLHYVVLAHADNTFDARALHTILDVMRGEHVRGGDGHGAQLVEGKHAKPKLATALQDEHHHVAASHAERLEIGGRAVRYFFQLGKGEASALALVVCPKERQLFRLFVCPYVNYVITEIEMFGHNELQIVPKILLVLKGCLF